MKVLILNSAEHAVDRAAAIVAETIAQNPSAVLGLATGGTMVPLYKRLLEIYRDTDLSFRRVSTFNLDEYVGLSPDHPASYHTYMRNVLFDHVDINLAQTHLPLGDAKHPAAEADRYEDAIEAAGGLDLQLLGIGQNGHIGFNEPTSSLASRTRIKTLTASTIVANRPYFSDDTTLPKYALTMGVGTILEARHCVMLATGSNKAEAIRAAIEGPVSAACPASALQLHPKATIVLDQEAAGKLTLLDYYQHVHPEGGKNEFEQADT